MTDGSSTGTGVSFDVELTLDGIDPDVDQQRVLDLYESNVRTFVKKNRDYGSSFVKSGMIASIYECGEIDPDIVIEHIARQISVRMQDKQARLYQTLLNDDHDRMVADESTIDSLLDLGNYAIMLASQLVKYHEGGFQGQHPELETLNDLTSADETTLREVLTDIESDVTDGTTEMDGAVGITIDDEQYWVDDETMTPDEVLRACNYDAEMHGLKATNTLSSIPSGVTIDLRETDEFHTLQAPELDQPRQEDQPTIGE